MAPLFEFLALTLINLTTAHYHHKYHQDGTHSPGNSQSNDHLHDQKSPYEQHSYGGPPTYYGNHGYHNLQVLHNKMHESKAFENQHGHRQHHNRRSKSNHHSREDQHFYDFHGRAQEWKAALREINLLRASIGWHHLEWSDTLASEVQETAFDEQKHSFPPTVISRPSDYTTMNLVQGVRQLADKMLYDGHLDCTTTTDGTCKPKADSAQQEWPWGFVDTHAKKIGCRARLYTIKKGVLHLEVVCKTDVHTNRESPLFNLHQHIKNQHLLKILKEGGDGFSTSSSGESGEEEDNSEDGWDQLEEDEIMNLPLEGEQGEGHYLHQAQGLVQHHDESGLPHHHHLPSRNQLYNQSQKEQTQSTQSNSSSSVSAENMHGGHFNHHQHNQTKLTKARKGKKNADYSSGLSSSNSSSSSVESGENGAKKGGLRLQIDTAATEHIKKHGYHGKHGY